MAEKNVKNNITALGIVSFFTDVSSEMIFPLLSIFLTAFMGAGKEIVGLVEGLADSAASLTDIVFGYLSDKTKKRKQFVIIGYGLSSILKAGIAFATSWPQILIFRGAERIGKSIRTSPRDAIIAASAAPKERGKAFGFHRAMDTAGAIIGPGIAYLILTYMNNSELAYRTVFQLAIIPAFIAVAIIILLVREPKSEEKKKEQEKIGFWKRLKMLDNNYKKFLRISCLFSLSYFSFGLLILRANEIGIGAESIMLLYMIYNIVYAAISTPIGAMADRVGKKTVIASSFLLYAAICIGFAFASSWIHVLVLFILYAVFVSTDESVNKAYISDITEEKTRGTALGAYSSAVGAMYLPASVIFGWVWAVYGAVVAFPLAAGVAAISGGLMFLNK